MGMYLMKEMPDMQNRGKKVTYPTWAFIQQKSTQELAQRVHQASTFTVGDIEGVLKQVAVELANMLADGNSVKIDGIGTFTPSLALVKGKEREENDEEGRKRYARSIVVGKVNFRAEKDLIWNINGRLSLERASWKRKRSSEKYTKEQRLELLKDALDKTPFVTVLDYCKLTGLVRSTATIEIREWAQQPQSSIGTMGRGSHRVYIKKNEVEL